MAAPLPESDMSRTEFLRTARCDEVLRQAAKDHAHRMMRAQNMADINFGSGRHLAERLLYENEDFMEMWHTALAYLETPDEMGAFMSNNSLLDRMVPLMVQGGNYWWTPCGLSLWCCLTPDSVLVVPCYYMQRLLVWGLCCPVSTCFGSCYRSLVGPLAPETKNIDERKVLALEKVVNDAIADAAAEIEKHPEWEFNPEKKGSEHLQPDEIIQCARLSLSAYMPTVDRGEKVRYNVFVPLVRERFIEKRAREGFNDAQESLNSFVEFFYTPDHPDTRSGDNVFGYGKQINEVLSVMGFDVVEGFDISKTDTQGFIAKSKGFDEQGGDIVISFRGTTSIKDWAVNMTGRQVPFDPEDKKTVSMGFVHSGFNWAFMSALPIIQARVLPLIDSGKPVRVIVTGHSLGGALATLTTGFLMAHYSSGLPENVSHVLTVTFGNPKVGNKDFCAFVSKSGLSKYKLFRLHNQKDPVPMTPPAGMGYNHCFLRAVLSPDGRIYFPDDSDANKRDLTTNALTNFASIGSDILGFHDIFNYADATFRFRARCQKAGVNISQ